MTARSILIPLILLLALASVAEAGGRWGVRLEYPLQAVAYAEQVVWSTSWQNPEEAALALSGLEILAGTEAVLDDTQAVTPYLGIALYWSEVWGRLEVASPFSLDSQRFGYYISFSFGGSWD